MADETKGTNQDLPTQPGKTDANSRDELSETQSAQGLSAARQASDFAEPSAASIDSPSVAAGAQPVAAGAIPPKQAPAQSTDAPREAAPRVNAAEVAHDADNAGFNLLYDVELDATLQFGSREMLLRDVLELSPGDVVELDRHIAEPVDLVVGDRIVARGEVVVASGNFALRVTEVATPRMRLESIRCLF